MDIGLGWFMIFWLGVEQLVESRKNLRIASCGFTDHRCYESWDESQGNSGRKAELLGILGGDKEGRNQFQGGEDEEDGVTVLLV